MNKSIKDIKKLLDSGITDKKEYHSLLISLDESIKELLKTSGYDYSKTRTINLFKLNEDQRLESINKLEEEFSNNEIAGVCEAVEYWHNVFNDFLSVYYFGYCHNFNLDKRGFFNIEISCLLYPGSDSGRKESNRINFEKKINLLKSMGIEIEKSKRGNDLRILNTGNNNDIIRNFLKEHEAKMIKIESIDDEIRKISFSVSAININKFEIEKELFYFQESEILNADEIIKLKKLCSNIIGAATCMYGDLLHTCGSLVELYFSNICKTLNFNGDIRKMCEARHLSAREKNMEIYNKKKAMGQKVPLEVIKDGAMVINDILDGYFANKIGFYLNELEFQEYGGIQITLRYVALDYYGAGKLIEEDDLKQIFETVGEKRTNEELYIIDSQENRDFIENFLLQIPSLDIRSINSIYKNNKSIITSIEINISSIKDILKLEFEKGEEF